MNAPSRRERPALYRLPLLALGFIALIVGTGAGLARLGWPMPDLAASAAALHGPLMITGFFGVVIEWQGAGNGQFRRGGPGLNQAFLASYGSNQTAGIGAAAFANVNLATFNGVDDGNAAFSGASKYLLFNFQASGSTYYGWIEILATTTGVDGGTISRYSATLGRWAYDTSGTAITAGQIITSAVPGGAGLAALAFGAAGLRGRRRSRN